MTPTDQIELSTFSGMTIETFQLGEWQVDPVRNSISQGDVTRDLTPMAMRVLCILARHAGELVTRDTLIEQVWDGNYHTGPTRLNDEMWRIRAAFEEDPKSPRFFKTVPRKGYVLLQAPTPLTTASQSEPAEPSSATWTLIADRFRLHGEIGDVQGSAATWHRATDQTSGLECTVLIVNDPDPEGAIIAAARRMTFAQELDVDRPSELILIGEEHGWLALFPAKPTMAIERRLAVCKNRKEAWLALSTVCRVARGLDYLGISAESLNQARLYPGLSRLQIHTPRLAAPSTDNTDESTNLAETQRQIVCLINKNLARSILSRRAASRLSQSVHNARSWTELSLRLDSLLEPSARVTYVAMGFAVLVCLVSAVLLVSAYSEIQTYRERLIRTRSSEQDAISFFTEIVNLASVDAPEGRKVYAHRILDRGKQLVPILSQSETLQVRLLLVLSRLAYELSDGDESVELAEEASRRSRLIDDPDVVVEAGMQVGWALRMSGHAPEAEQAYRSVISLLDGGETKGDDALTRAMANEGVAVAIGMQGRLQEAEALLRSVVAVRRAALGLRHYDTVRAMLNLAIALGYSPETLEESKSLMTLAVTEFTESVGPKSPALGRALASLGSTLARIGRVDEGLARLQDATKTLDQSLGPGAADTLNARMNLIEVLSMAGKLREASDQMAIADAALATRPNITVNEQIELESARGDLSSAGGDAETASEHYSKAIQMGEVLYGRDGPEVKILRQKRCGQQKRVSGDSLSHPPSGDDCTPD